MFFLQNSEPSKNPDVGEVRGADGGGSSNKVSLSIDTGPMETEPVQKHLDNHRKSGLDPEWLKNPKYSPWLYQTTHGKFQFVDLASF